MDVDATNACCTGFLQAQYQHVLLAITISDGVQSETFTKATLANLLSSSSSETPQLRRSPRGLSRRLVSKGQPNGTSVLGKRPRTGDYATDFTQANDLRTSVPPLKEPPKYSESL